MSRKTLQALAACFTTTATFLAAYPVLAADLSIEEPGWRNAPAPIAQLIARIDANQDMPECRPYQVRALEGAPNIRLVTTQVACWGNAAAPLWFVVAGPRPRILFTGYGYGIRTEPGRHEMPVITTTSATAAFCSEETWRYVRGRYRMVRTVNCLQ